MTKHPKQRMQAGSVTMQEKYTTKGMANCACTIEMFEEEFLLAFIITVLKPLGYYTKKFIHAPNS